MRPNVHKIRIEPLSESLMKVRQRKLEQFIESHPEMSEGMTTETLDVFTYVHASQEFQREFGPDSDYMAGDYNIHHTVHQKPESVGFTNSYCRSIFWRVYLGCFGAVQSPYHWPAVLHQHRQLYESLVHRYALPLGDDIGRGGGVNDDNIAEFIALGDTIKLDLLRTHPTCGFFSHPEIQNALLNILYVWCIDHNEGYKQGMNELAASLLVAVVYDALDTQPQLQRLMSKIQKHVSFTSLPGSSTLQHPLDPNLNPTNLQERLELVEYAFAMLTDQTYIVHDTYTLFCGVMKNMGQFYSITAAANAQNALSSSGQANQYADPNAKSAPKQPQATLSSRSGVSSANNVGSDSEPPIVVISHQIFNQLLPLYDPDLYRHLSNIDVIPTLFLLRWVRLLFCREYESLDEVAVLHDALFATSQDNFSLLPYLAVAMLHLKRDDLLRAEDTSDAFEFLLRPAQNDWWSDDEENDQNDQYGDENSVYRSDGADDEGASGDSDQNGAGEGTDGAALGEGQEATAMAETTATTAVGSSSPNKKRSLFDKAKEGVEAKDPEGSEEGNTSQQKQQQQEQQQNEADDTLVPITTTTDDLLGDIFSQRNRGTALSSASSSGSTMAISSFSPNAAEQIQTRTLSLDTPGNTPQSSTSFTIISPKIKRERPITICTRSSVSSFPQRVVTLALTLQKKVQQLPKTGKAFTPQQLERIHQHHSNIAKLPAHQSTPGSKKLQYSGTDYDRAQFGKTPNGKEKDGGSGGGLFGFVSKLVESTPKRPTDKIDKPEKTPKSSSKRGTVVIKSEPRNKTNYFEQQSEVLMDASIQKEQLSNLAVELATVLDSILAPYQDQIDANTIGPAIGDVAGGDGAAEQKTDSNNNASATTTDNTTSSIQSPTTTQSSTPSTTTTTFSNSLDDIVVSIKLSQLVLLKEKITFLQNSIHTASGRPSLLLPTDDYFRTNTSKTDLSQLGNPSIYHKATYDAGGQGTGAVVGSDGAAVVPATAPTGNHKTRAADTSVLYSHDLGLDGIDLAAPTNGFATRGVAASAVGSVGAAALAANAANATTPTSTPSPAIPTPHDKLSSIVSPTTAKATKSAAVAEPKIISSHQIAAMSLFGDDDEVTPPVHSVIVESSTIPDLTPVSSPASAPISPDQGQSTVVHNTPSTTAQPTESPPPTPTPSQSPPAPVEIAVPTKVYKAPIPNQKGLLFGDDDDDSDDGADLDIFRTAVSTRTRHQTPSTNTTSLSPPQPARDIGISPSQPPAQTQTQPSKPTSTQPAASAAAVISTAPTPTRSLFDDDPDDIFSSKPKAKKFDEFSSLFD